MPFNKLPVVDNCCRCITDLKTATAIIAVLAIVTSPAVTWAVVRHSFVIRVSCYVTTDTVKPDIVDINLHNILSFGFGANAGLGPSCLSKKKNTTNSSTTLSFLTDSTSSNSSPLIKVVQYVGWVVLAADLIFVLAGLILLIHLYREGETRLYKFIKCFMYCALIAIVLSFAYGMLYVTTCLVIGGSFPIFELTFAFIDLGIWSLWLYFIIVVRSYLHQIEYRLERLKYYYYYTFIDFVEVAKGYYYKKLYNFLDSHFFRRIGDYFHGIRNRFVAFLIYIDRIYGREPENRTTDNTVSNETLF